MFYGWCIVLTAALGLCFGDGPIIVLAFGVFFKALAESLHAGRAAVSFAFTLHNVVAALSIPLIGGAIDRFGARRVILGGTAVFGATLLFGGMLPARIGYLYLFFGTLGAVAGSTSPVPYGTVVARWFDRRRGLALGTMAIGLGVGGVFMPFAAERLIALHGWRWAYAAFGAAALVLTIPVVAVFLEERPQTRGLAPDGVSAGPAPQHSENEDGLSWRETYMSGTFWLLLAAFFLAGASVYGCTLHLSAMLTDRGVSAERAAAATSLVGAAVFVGRIVAGYLLDRVFAPRLAMVFFSGAAIGIALLWAGAIGLTAFVAAFLLGLGMGAEVDVIAFLMSRYFGLRSLGTAFGFGFGSFALSGATGVFLMGIGFEWLRSYSAPLGAFFAAEVAAIVLMARLGPYRYRALLTPSAVAADTMTEG